MSIHATRECLDCGRAWVAPKSGEPEFCPACEGADIEESGRAILTKHQVKTFGPKPIAGYGRAAKITAIVRYDDQCGNGHNTFSITAEIRNPWRHDIVAGGCMHTEIAKAFPELAPLIRWHLVSSDGPMHYIANTLYWLGYSGFCDGKPNSPPNLANARNAACWPDMPEDLLADRAQAAYGSQHEATIALMARLEARLPALLAEFRAAVESLGFVF